MNGNADIEYLVSEIISRMPALSQESAINAHSLLMNLMAPVIDKQIQQALKARSDDRQQLDIANKLIGELQSALWHAGWCPKCKSEIVHDIMEPFAQCGCPDGFCEATEVPIIPGLRYKLAQSKAALQQAFEDLKDAASGYAPYPFNHEQNPYCKTLVGLGKALELPAWEVIKGEEWSR